MPFPGTSRTRASRLRRAPLLAGLIVLGACSHIPFLHREPDLARSHASAENMIRLDAALRSGCEHVSNIDPGGTATHPQGRWVAHTCNGDLAYDVTVERPAKAAPVVKIMPVPGPAIRPMTPGARPAMPGE